MKRYIRMLAVTAVALLACTACEGDPTKGHNVTEVIYGNGNNQLGSFIQTGNDKWEERSDGVGNFLLAEVSRDEWSVYLHDANRGLNVQLDLWTGEIIYDFTYGDRNRDPHKLYVISASSD